MGRREKQRWYKQILGMILIPILLAVVLFSTSEKKAGGKGEGSGSIASGQEASVERAVEENAAGKDNTGNAAKPEAVDTEDDGEAGTADEMTASEESSLGGTSQTAALYDPVQEISFVPASGDGNELQRSIPVDIDAAILGGLAGTRCWAVFLSAEMEKQPRIVFSKYEKVTLVPLGESERLGTGRLWRDSDTESGAAGSVEETGVETGASDSVEETGVETGASGSDEETGVETGASGSVEETGVDTGASDSVEETGVETGASGSDEESAGYIGTDEIHEYSSGDQAVGLANGSAFRVRMTSEDGAVQETDLYVFSCRDSASMYLDTKSGSMEIVDSDLTKETTETARFAVYKADGALDSTGECSVGGRGNSTWMMKKRPYNVNLTEKQSVLGMKECRKLCLLANTFDPSNLLDRIASQMAQELGMRDTPQGEFVNLYLNGKYNGLYFLSQRPRTGGCVHIKKLDNKILEANGQSSKNEDGTRKEKTELNIPKRIALHEDGSRLYKWAYNWPNEPKNNTGGYLLQQYARYEGSGCWFSTNHRRFRIMSPSYPTVGEVNYLSEYMLSAERAIYSEDGIDPETGKRYESFLDMPSWEDMFLIEEFFAEWDAERWSFYITKDRDDPLLYCGPMWDFDHSAGTMIYGSYPETAVSMLLFRDTRHGWMYKLLSHDEFVEELHARWQERFSPMVHNYLEQQMEKEAAAIETSAYMNNIRRANDYDYHEEIEKLGTWFDRRLAFLDDYSKTEDGKENSENYCCVMFEFSWGTLSHYVLRGESLGYLPLSEYGETQIPSQIEKNEIIGWQDENGKEIDSNTVIDADRTFKPIYR